MSRTVKNWHHADGGVTNADSSLWGTYTRGMDDWIAQPSREAAEKYALAMNAAIVGQAKYDDIEPWVWVTPDLWPFDAASHAESLKREA